MLDKKLIIGTMGMLMIAAALGYVLAATYISTKFFGWSDEPKLTFLFKNLWAIKEQSPAYFNRATLFFIAPIVIFVISSPFIFMERLTKFGETHWQTKSELKKNKFLNKTGNSFLLGKLGSPQSKASLLSSATFPHVMVVGQTGRGKGVGFVIPNLLAFEGSTVTLDVSSENFEATSRYRQQKGDKVYRFAPTDFSRPNHRYNPLDRISKLASKDQQQLELRKLATLFLQTDSMSAKSFLEGGISLFTAAGMLAFERGRPTMGEIYRILTNGGDQKVYAGYKNEVNAPAAKLIFQRMAKEHSETVSSYVSVMMSSGLSNWENPAIDNATSRSDFSFRDFRKIPSSVYLCMTIEDLKALKALVRMFFSDLIGALHESVPGKDEPWPVMIMLDEFDALGKMPSVPDSIKTLRKHGGRLAVITQTIPALDEIYGDKVRKSIQGGAGLKLYLTPSDQDTIDEMSESIGKATKRIVSRSKKMGTEMLSSRNISERTEERPLLSADEARRMDLSDVIIVVDAQHPIRAKRIQYFDDSMLKPMFESQGQRPLPYPDQNKADLQAVRSENQDILARLDRMEASIANGRTTAKTAMSELSKQSKPNSKTINTERGGKEGKDVPDSEYNQLAGAINNLKNLEARIGKGKGGEG